MRPFEVRLAGDYVLPPTVGDIVPRVSNGAQSMTSVPISHFHAIATPNVPWCRNLSGSDQKMADQLGTSCSRYAPKTAGLCNDSARFVFGANFEI
jgi:hypothetical protein